MEQNSDTIANRVIKKIEEEHVAPLGKWRFVLKNNTFWTLWGLSVVIGACAVAATIFVCINAGWRYHQITNDSFSQFFFDVIPLFWVLSLTLMIILGYYNVRHTSRGYRFSFYIVILSSVIISFIGGTILYAVGVGKNIDNFRDPLPFGDPIMTLEEERWNNSNRGLFSGTVKSFDNTTELLTLNLSGGKEKVFSTIELSEIEKKWLIAGAHIRIIGGSGVDNPELTIACVILPWEEPGVPYTPRQIHLPQELQPERKEDVGRINMCRGISPYQKYKEVFDIN